MRRKLEIFRHPKDWDNVRITTVIRGKKDAPIDARRFGKLIVANVKLLESLAKEVAPDERKDILWAIIEANMIGQDASYTLQAYSKRAIKEHQRKSK